MKAEIKVIKVVDIKILAIEANVRYWEDAIINGIEDTEGKLTPCRCGDLWCPVIDVDSGIIKNWRKGVKASIHFKVCDNGSYYLQDADRNNLLSIEENYVPTIACTGGAGYGDYIIMDIDKDGKIAGWDPDISDFLTDSE